MRKLTPVLILCVVAGTSGVARSADEPRELIERAIKAAGGEEKLSQKVGIALKIKGTVYLPQGGDTKVTFTADGFNQADGKSRLDMKAEALGQKIEMIQVTGDGIGWRKLNDAIQDMNKDELDDLKRSKYHDRVIGLLVLVKEKGYTFGKADDVDVDGKPARGVKVSFKGQADTTLYFDKESGLLVKSAYRAKKPGENQEGLHETIYSDYREPDGVAALERSLKDMEIPVENEGLLKYLRSRVQAGDPIEKVKQLIRQLGDDAFEVREKATKDLIAVGQAAVPLLRQAAKDPDPEVSRRAQQCLEKIGDKTSSAPVSAAAVQLLALRKPAGAAAVLLDLLPGADEVLAREIRAALYVLAQGDKPDEALVKALDDKDPVRQAAAKAALGKDDGAYLKQPGRRVYLTGIKQPRKLASYVDGKKLEEHELVDVQFFNDFDAKLFAKP
jgi:hypothetical protein